MRIVGIDAAAKATFPELEVDKAIALVMSFSRHSALSFKGELTYPGYNYVPTSYILCEKDSNMTPAIQRQYIDRIETESGNDVDVRTLNTGHCPNITAPEKLAQIVVDIARSA